MLATTQRSLALLAIIMLLVLQTFGATMHKSAHAAEHADGAAGLHQAFDDLGNIHHHHDADRNDAHHDGTPSSHTLHHALHHAMQMFEYVQTVDDGPVAFLAACGGASVFAKIDITAVSTIICPPVPPPNA